MAKNPIGQKFNSLLVLERVVRHDGKRKRTGYKCLCDCGKTKPYSELFDLKTGRITSCGCKSLERPTLIKDISGNHYGALVVIIRLNTRTADGYDYLCKCSCGKEKIVKYNNLVRGDTKSCGCKSDYYNSINNGGTGIPREHFEIQKSIRLCKQYKNFVKTCLLRAGGMSELSGNTGKLAVHHIHSISDLIERYNLTKSTYLQCMKLFDPANGVVLTETEHRKFHSLYGLKTVEADWTNFTVSN